MTLSTLYLPKFLGPHALFIILVLVFINYLISHTIVECYNCEKYGHHAKECYAKKRVEESANLAEALQKMLYKLAFINVTIYACDGFLNRHKTGCHKV